MQTRPLPFWLMIVSTAMAVLPVWRSPMISSRSPGPLRRNSAVGLVSLALAAADRDERVDGLDAGLDRGVDRLADDDARRDALDGPGLLRVDRALVVERPPERVDDAAQQRLADRHLDHAARRLDGVAFLDRV